MPRLSLAVIPAIAALFVAPTAHAQRAPVPGQVVTHDQWQEGSGLPPGEYRIRWRAANLCMGERRGSGLVLAHLVLMTRDCSGERFAPHSPPDPAALPQADYAWLWVVPLGGQQNALMRYSGCLTRARGVVFGAPRADFTRCTGSNRLSTNFQLVRLPEDQRFGIQKSSVPSGFFFRSGRECVVTRDARTDPGVDLLLSRCNGTASQEVEFVYIGPLPQELQREHLAAVDYYYATTGQARPAATPPAANPGTVTVTTTMDASAMLGVLSQQKGGVANPIGARPDVAGSLAGGAVQAARLVPPSGALDVGVPAALSLDMGSAVTTREIDLTGTWDRWRLTVPYRFAVEGLKAVGTECAARNAAGQVVGERSLVTQIDGPSAGNLVIGLPAASDVAADMVTVQCKVALSGDRAGVDWEAWTFPENGAPNGWAVWVREAGKSRWWTGAGFRQDYSLRFEVGLPR